MHVLPIISFVRAILCSVLFLFSSFGISSCRCRKHGVYVVLSTLSVHRESPRPLPFSNMKHNAKTHQPACSLKCDLMQAVTRLQCGSWSNHCVQVKSRSASVRFLPILPSLSEARYRSPPGNTEQRERKQTPLDYVVAALNEKCFISAFYLVSE